MISSRRIILLAAPAAAIALLLAPTAAMAAETTETGFVYSTHPSGSVISPGQTLSGHFAGNEVALGQVVAGDAYTVHAVPIIGAENVCEQGVEIGHGAFEASTFDNAVEFTTTIYGAIPDSQAIVFICNSMASGGSLLMFDNPFALSTPVDGEAVDLASPVLSGTGSPGSTVAVQTADGSPAGTTEVGDDGTWTLTLENAAEGTMRFTFTQNDKTFDADLVIVADVESTPLIDPLVGAASLAVLGLGALAVFRRRAAARA